MSDKHSHVIDRLKSQAEDVTRLCAGLDEAAISRRARPEQWSVKEVLAHVERVQQVFEGRLESMLTQESPAILSYSPENDAEFTALSARSSSELLALFQKTRARVIGRLERLSPADWHRSGRHPDYPRYDVHVCIEYMRYHEGHHMHQMFERRALLGASPAH